MEGLWTNNKFDFFCFSTKKNLWSQQIFRYIIPEDEKDLDFNIYCSLEESVLDRNTNKKLETPGKCKLSYADIA